MRIIHLCRVAPPSVGGMEAVIAGLAAAQHRAGHEVSVLTTWAHPEGARAWTLPSGVPVRALRRRGPARYPFAAGLRAALRGADVVHVHGVDGLADQALRVRDATTAVGVSTHGAYLHTRRQWWLKQAWMRSWTRWSLARADAVWFTSASDQRALAPARLSGVVVPNGLEVPELRREVVPGRWLSLGRVTPHKGHARVVRVLAHAVEAGHDLHLNVVGPLSDPVHAAALKALAASLGVGERVTLCGEVSEGARQRALATAAWAWFLSEHEGFGLAAMEACAAGVPTVVSPIDAFRSLGLAEHGAIEACSTEPRAVAEQVVAISAARREALGHRGREHARRFAWSAMTPVWTAAYESMLEARCASD